MSGFFLTLPGPDYFDEEAKCYGRLFEFCWVTFQTVGLHNFGKILTICSQFCVPSKIIQSPQCNMTWQVGSSGEQKYHYTISHPHIILPTYHAHISCPHIPPFICPADSEIYQNYYRFQCSHECLKVDYGCRFNPQVSQISQVSLDTT